MHHRPASLRADVLYQKNLWQLQELCFTVNETEIVSARLEMLDLMRELDLEYQVMLYGRSAAGDQKDERHFRLVVTGIIQSKEADILYDSGSCLALDPALCWSPGSEFYKVGGQHTARTTGWAACRTGWAARSAGWAAQGGRQP